MPGEPPSDDQRRGEIEELIAVGFHPTEIIGVERDPLVAERLYEHYYDRIVIHCDTAEMFAQRTTGTYAYAHFDFCSALMPDYVTMLALWGSRLGPVSRLRVSVQSTRRRREQQSYEQYLRTNFMQTLCDAAQVPPSISTDLVTSDDITHLIAFLWLMFYTFGEELLVYLDEVCKGNVYLPSPGGTHQLCNLRRFSYHEPLGHTVMYSIWADLVALDPTFPFHSNFARSQVLNLAQTLQVPTSAFTPADLDVTKGLFIP